LFMEKKNDLWYGFLYFRLFLLDVRCVCKQSIACGFRVRYNHIRNNSFCQVSGAGSESLSDCTKTTHSLALSRIACSIPAHVVCPTAAHEMCPHPKYCCALRHTSLYCSVQRKGGKLHDRIQGAFLP